jgi:hypothetical protein
MASTRLVAGISAGIVVGAGVFAALATTPASAELAPASAAGGCSATVSVDSQWGSGSAGGQVLRVTVTNTSPSPATDWTVTWTLGAGQKVRSAWNAAVGTSGTTVTAVNKSSNGKLAAGAATSFGVQLTGVAGAPTLTCDNGGGTPAADVTVTESDNGGSVTLQVGQTLAVSLPSDYLLPAVSSPAVTQVSGSGGYSTGSPLVVLYRAAVGGPADITTRHNDFTSDWVLHVTVNSPGSTGAGVNYDVTAADNLSTLTMVSGDFLRVSLPSLYVSPTVTPDGILNLVSVTGGYPTADPLVALYVAHTTGKVDVASYTDIACNHEPMPCPSPSVSWLLHVVVS